MRNMNRQWMEAMTVVASVAFVLALVFPAASTARSDGRSALCLANLHVLGKAWLAYQEDNDGWLVGLSYYYSGSRATPYRWVERPLFRDTDNLETGVLVPSYDELKLEYQLNGVRAGKLFDYSGNEQAYHCPNDRYWLTLSYGPWISYAGSGCMNSEDFISGGRLNDNIYNPIRPDYYRKVILPSGRVSELKVAVKFNEIISPASRFTFVEEDYANPLGKDQPFYTGGFVTMSSNNYWSWWDWPAGYHDGRSTLGFADGHAESHVWQDQRTLKLTRNDFSSSSIVQIDNADIVYVNNGYVPAGW